LGFLLVASFVAVPLAVFAFQFGVEFLIPFEVVLIALCAWGYGRAGRRSLPTIRALAPSPAPVEAFPVAFDLSYQGVVTGRDEGIASFVEGWLYVEGLRTGFSLRPLDAKRIGAMPEGSEAFDLPGGQRITLRALGSASDRLTFGETVRVWYRFTVGVAVGEPTLPPLRVHPTAIVTPLTVLAATALLVPACLAWALWTLVVHPDAAGTLIPVFTGLVVGSRPVGKAVQDLRKLKSIDRLGLEAEARESLPPP